MASRNPVNSCYFSVVRTNDYEKEERPQVTKIKSECYGNLERYFTKASKNGLVVIFLDFVPCLTKQKWT